MTKSDNKFHTGSILQNLVYLLLLGLGFFILILLINSGKINVFDNVIYDSLRGLKSHSTKQFVKFLGVIGDPQVDMYLGLALSALGIVVFARKEGYSKYSAYAAAFLIANFSNPLLKAFFERPHPDVEVDKYSFPSNHATMAFLFYMVLFIEVNKRIKIRAGRIILAVFCIVMPLLIGFSRVYLKNHYASDIVGGYLAAGMVFAVITLLKNIFVYFSGKKASEKISG